MARIISIISIVIGGFGLFFGFYYLDIDLNIALNIVTSTTVGVVGLFAFIRHVIFHKSDAKRLGWETQRPDWMFEVGFANLAFSLMAFASVLLNLGVNTQAIVLFGYAIYLFQASMLHGYRYFTDEIKSPTRLWRSCITTLAYSVMISIFTLEAISK